MSDTVFPLDDFDISPDLENCYIRQNLPVRRQSLVVYHDKLRSEQQQCQDEDDDFAENLPPTRHYSLNYLSSMTDTNNKPRNNNSRLYTSKSLSAIHSGSNNKNRIQLSVIITQPDSQSDFSSSATSTESPSYDTGTPMHTLYEESVSTQSNKQQSMPKFIGKKK